MSDEGDNTDEDDAPFGDLLDEIDRERSGGDDEAVDGSDEPAESGEIPGADDVEREPADGASGAIDPDDEAEDQSSDAVDEAKDPPVDTDSEGDVPFGNLLDDIDRTGGEARTEGTDAVDGTDEDSFDEAFTEETYDEVDPDELWDELSTEPTSEQEGDSGDETDTEFAPGTAFAEQQGTNVVPKRSFCETCRHLSDPPEFRCTNDGTAILEFVDRDHVRVRDCPIVEERREQSELK